MSFINKEEKTLNHLFNYYNVALNIWFIIGINCHTHRYSNLCIIDWIVSIWSRKYWYNKLYGNTQENNLTILWAI